MPMSGPARLLLIALVSFAFVAAWVLKSLIAPRPEPDPDPGERFSRWQSAHQQQVSAYLGFLKSKDVGGVLPPEQLLRQGRRWKLCGGTEFGVPPAELWPDVVPTLQLLADLRSQGLLVGAHAASGYRTGDYNHCEGGSSASRHLSNRAIDLDLPETSASQVEALCVAWHKQGPARKWGLGFYSPARVHLDTAGFRTWGYDFHAASSLCVIARPN